MTKRLSIALIAVALFVVLAVLPVSASTVNPNNYNGTVIDAGATVFIGEQGLNLTHAMNQALVNAGGAIVNYDNAPSNLTISWWASGSTSANPDFTADISARYRTFTVDQDTFVGRTGNWYLTGTTGGQVGKLGVVMNVQDPQLSVAAWDYAQGKDVTGLNVVQGAHLGIKVTTNMYAATYTNRNNTVSTTWNLGTINTGLMPDGTQSTWNHNYTGNATIIDSTSSVWVVSNYTAVSKMTYGSAGVFGNGNKTYWNSSTAIPDAAVSGNAWTAKNFTFDAAGLVPANGPWTLSNFTTPVFTPTSATDGFINLKVKDESGATLTRLYVGTTQANAALASISYVFVNTQPFISPVTDGSQWWVTDALNNGQYAYPVGTYSVWAESALNNMKDNYKNAGADYTGKTISGVGTVTLVSDSVKIEANKDSVVRSKTFSVSITGKASQTYYVWVKNSNTMNGGIDDQPPSVVLGQEKVYVEGGNDATYATYATNHPIGNYLYENGGGVAGTGDIWSNTANGTVAGSVQKNRYYALINTSTSGTRTVEFTTTNWTKAQKYTIRVEQHMPSTTSGYGADYTNAGAFKSDEVDINVEKGAVTIVAAGDQSYYLGEEIKFSGTNTETYKTYLLLIGPNLPQYGAQIASQDPRNNAVTNNDATTFKVVDVNGDNTWSWKWGTASYALDAGTYTIYAISQPSDTQSSHLTNAAYGTVSVIIKKPFVSATASQSTVAKGDKVFITGTAEGDPSSVSIWIMGKNYAAVNTESVNSDSSFSYEIKQETTKGLSSGQYFVVVQHPMQNKQFDVYLSSTASGTADYGYVLNRLLVASGSTSTAGSHIFKLLGSNSLQGSDAAEALAEGINDANVDDTYTKLQFLVEEPTIRIDAIGDKHVGDKFTITAQTNLAVDDEILVQVYSSSFKPTQKSQSGEFSGATGTVKVTKGDSGMNKISFDVDSSTFKPDEYIVTEDAVLQTATGTALFNVLETSAKTVAPTAVVTAAPTAVQTAVQTVAPTAAPVTTTKASPGFGALIALIGLGAVAFVVVRRH